MMPISSASAEGLPSRQIAASVQGDAVSDGHRWVAWTTMTGAIDLYEAPDRPVVRLDYPGCGAADVNAGALLLACDGPDAGPKVRVLATGQTLVPPRGAPGEASAVDPRHDYFGTIGRYWALGVRYSDDPKVATEVVYLDWRTGRTSGNQGARNLDSRILSPIRRNGACGAEVSGRPLDYQLRYAENFNRRGPLRLRKCATGALRRVSNCRNGCLPVGGGLRGRFIVWQQGLKTLVVYDPRSGRRQTWRLPYAYGAGPYTPYPSPSPTVVQAGRRLIVSSPFSPAAPPGAPSPTLAFRLDELTVPSG